MPSPVELAVCGYLRFFLSSCSCLLIPFNHLHEKLDSFLFGAGFESERSSVVLTEGTCSSVQVKILNDTRVSLYVLSKRIYHISTDYGTAKIHGPDRPSALTRGVYGCYNG